MKSMKEADALRAQLEKVKMMQQNHLQRHFPDAVQANQAPVSGLISILFENYIILQSYNGSEHGHGQKSSWRQGAASKCEKTRIRLGAKFKTETVENSLTIAVKIEEQIQVGVEEERKSRTDGKD